MDFPADLECLPQMLDFIRERAASLGMPEEKIYKMELASEEALVNIISYAYPGKSEKKIATLSLDCQKLGTTRFEVLIRDRGVPFNPIDAEITVDIHKPIEERKIGGLGIFMIRKLLDEVSYQRVGEENILRMVMSI